MLKAKDHREPLMEKVMALIILYMDYWLPLVVILTFPVWILPVLIYCLFSKLLQIFKCFLNIGNSLINATPTPDLCYAILKGNGRYLRDEGQSVHKKQFYDYTSRRFMSIGKFQSETKIIELECQSAIGLDFFTETISSGTVVGVQSNQELYRNLNNSLGLIVPTNYERQGTPVGYDCLLMFNFKNKMRAQGGESKIDLLKILAYCRYHMDRLGYIVYGDYFEEGQVQTYIDIFEGFKLKVADQEDITKNIDYARKLANKSKISFEKKVIDSINSNLDCLLGKKIPEQGKQFLVLILQKMDE